jgi:hypothetical protein
MNTELTAKLLADVREEVIVLVFSRYVFRTHQEIVRLNPRLQDDPHFDFCKWAQHVYAQANAVGVRRIASQTYAPGDVNLVRLLDMFIRDPGRLWECFERHYPDDAARVRAEVQKKQGTLAAGWEKSACKRLLSEDRKTVISAAEKANHFASKRVAHSVPDVEVRTMFSDLDDAIDVVKRITEKYTLLVCAAGRLELEPLHRAGKPTVYPILVQIEKNNDLLKEMKRRKLTKGWESVFLEVWATPDVIARPLGETPPPKRRASGG